jgi:hypothetical protein
MPLETRTLPGTIVKERGGDEVASGWCIIAYESGEKFEPLDEWRGEIIVEDSDARSAISDAEGKVLYLQCLPYGGEFESWHGPVLTELVPSEHDPYERRVRLRAAGKLERGDRAIPGTDWTPRYPRNTGDDEKSART